MWLDTDQIIIHSLICHQLISQVIQVIQVISGVFGSPNMQLFFSKSVPQVINFLNIILSVFNSQVFPNDDVLAKPLKPLSHWSKKPTSTG